MKTEEVILGNSFALKIPDGQVDVQEAAIAWRVHVHICLDAPEQHDSEEV